ncbi:uncharacterized protein LOC124795557 [Schistocerca piceifrons]|uniref:uncharacterized protein LOC124795557 n=1 Tax=Schistocerca piceifrons TaxID=274613 RepID=UPI001F5E67F0|nr:uncharacterized protein LOC124795557 [Schistocerca piceifrons]
MSLAFRLNVVEAKARIAGPSDLYVKKGSALSVVCSISQGPHDLGTVFWYRGAAILQPAPAPAAGARLRIDTDWTDALTSRLYIADARPSDSGNYTCVPTLASAASVNVHVINGEHPAAMQHGNKSSAVTSLKLPLSLSLSLPLALYTATALLARRLS